MDKNNIILQALVKKVQVTGEAVIRLNGHSMYPEINDGQLIKIVKYNFNDVKINDIIAFYFKNSRHFIIHRIVDIKVFNGLERFLITKGDNNNYPDAHAVKENNFVGLVLQQGTLNYH